MKPKWDKKYTTITIYGIIGIVTSGALLMLIYYLMFSDSGDIFQIIGNTLGILSPILYAVTFAYLINFILKFVENVILKKIWTKLNKPKIARIVSLIITYILTIILLAGFVWIVLPQVIESVQVLAKKFPEYYDEFAPHVQTFITENFKNIGFLDINQIFKYLESTINTLSQTLLNLLPQTLNFLTSTAMVVSNILIGFIISIYLLLSKETFIAQSKKIITAIFPERTHDNIFETLSLTNINFGGYLSGKLMSSLIIGVLYYLVFLASGVKYAILFSVILAVTNMIPFFGPVIGALPCILIVLMDKPWQFWVVVIAIGVIQMIEGNVLSPKLIGQNTGLTAFWILFSILIFGGFWGIFGMIIAVPIFSVIYTFIKRAIEKKLRKKDLPTKTNAYSSENKPIIF